MNFFCWDTDRLAKKEDIHRLENLLRQIEHNILNRISHISMKISELEAKLASYGDTLTKIQAEVQALKDSINTDPDVPQAVVDSVARIDSLLTSIDEINPDVTDVTDSGTGGTTLRG